MSEKLIILDDFCFDIDVSYGIDRSNSILYLSKSNPIYLIKKVKSKARELGVNFRTKKDYIDFFVKD